MEDYLEYFTKHGLNNKRVSTTEGQKILLTALMTSTLTAVTYCRDRTPTYMNPSPNNEFTFYYVTPLGKGIAINFNQNKERLEQGSLDPNSIFPCDKDYIPTSDASAVFELSVYFGTLVKNLFL